MEKETKKQQEDNVLEKFGTAYIKIPRLFFKPLYDGSKRERQQASLYLYLFVNCAYTKTQAWMDGKPYILQKGEWIGTMQELAGMTGMNYDQVRYNLKKLGSEKRIKTDRLMRGMRITVYGYASYTGVNQEKKKKETPEERAKREYYEMIEKIKNGRYI